MAPGRTRYAGAIGYGETQPAAAGWPARRLRSSWAPGRDEQEETA